MSVPGLLIDPEVVRECGPAVVLWSPACCQPMGPANGTSQWDQPVGPASGASQWGQPVGPASGASQWGQPMGPASGASQWGYLWASSSVGSSELLDAGGF
jgi:hypothetical protein